MAGAGAGAGAAGAERRPEQARHPPEDEESGGGCASADPAVLAMGPARKPLQYSREQLLALKNSPHAKLQPEITHEAFNTIRKRTESPNDEDRGARGDAPNDNHKGGGFARNDRRPADPRERVRKESEPSGGGIVLSPQRRSFTSGCGAPGVPAPPPTLARTRPESPLSTPGTGSNKNDSVRRIGSGRILTRDVTTVPWERSTGVPSEDLANEKQAAAEAEAKANQTSQPYRPPNALPRDRGDDRFERRSFGRDSFGTDLKRDRDRDERFGDKRDRDDNRRMNRFGGQRGRYDKDSEPEWFSGGPTSQLETIELRGFDEPSSKSRTTNGNAKDSEKWGSGGRSPVSTNGRWRKEPAAPAQPAAPASPPPARSTPTPNATTEDEPQLANNDKDSGVELKSGEDAPAAQEQMVDFNLDDFLKSDSIPDFTNGSVEPEGGSRFSRWFRRESPVGDHERLFNNIMDDLEGNNSESQHMFAPISPAGPPGSVPQQHQHQPAPPPPSLLELLQRANAASGTPHPPHNDMNAGGKMQSLEELEAQLRGARAPQLAAPASHPHTPTHQHDNDLTAFKRLLAQASGGHAVPGNHEPLHMKQQQQQQQHLQQQQQQPPMSLLQMLNKSVEQQHKQQQAQQQAQQQQPPHIPQELLYKLLQVQQSQQQQQQQQQHQQQQEMGPGSLPEHELLARPEASAIIRGLKHGEITSQHLIQQLGNPGLQSRHREMLLSILRQHNMQQQHQHHQMGGSPLPGSMGAPHLVVPPHHQPLRLSPLPPQTFCVSPIMPTSPNTLTVHQPGAPPAHMPSPHELSYRAQTIMQNALIKKKLEEARENYRRRHDPQAKQSISFTPTSVLRQMTADKETESHIGGKPGQPWPQMPQKVPQGRPIVKGNHGASGMNNVSPQMGMFPPTPTGFHSPPHYHNHPQMSGGMHQFPHQQQRQPQPPQMSRGGGGNTTLHQLLVQSHHRSINGQSQLDGGIGMGGDATSNQLARWFSPELLAQASAGKLPSVHVPNALSLEDLERNHHSATVRN